jgi:hypothetical protein
MPVSNKHPQFIDMQSEWQKAADFYHSEKRVHYQGITYLPKLSGQTDDEYTSYKSRAALSMFFKKTVETYRGMATRKPVSVEDDKSIEEYMENVTGTGDSLLKYVYDTLEGYFVSGRCGTLIDLPEGATNADPMFLYYDPLAILNWKKEEVDGVDQLTMVVLAENVVKDDGDEFNTETKVQYRVLDLDEGKYRVRVFDDAENQIGEEIFPLMNNKTMDFIPFIIHGGVPVKPPFLTEIIDQNVHHYQVTADQMHGLHWAGLPTPYVTGVDPEDAPKHIGSSRFICVPDPNGKVGFLEFEGQGLMPIADKLKVFEETISSLAVNMILNSDQTERTATQSNIDSSSQTASLAGTVNLLSSEFTTLLGWAAEWMSKEAGAVKINTDFVSSKMSPQELDALFKAYIGGGISYQTFWMNLQQGEVASESKDFEKELSDIEENLPPGLVEPDAGGDGGGE